MLVLADADALRLDLHEFRERVLQPSRDAHRTAQAHVQVGHLLARVLACRVDRGAGLADDDLVDLRLGRELLDALDQVGGKLVGLAARGAVADRDQVHTKGRDEPAECVQRTFPVASRFVRVDRRGREHLAGGIDHRHLAAGADAGVQPHHDARAGRCGEQQVTQVLGEHLDRDVFGLFAQAPEQVALEAQAQLDLPGPRNRLADQLVGGTLAVAPAQMYRDAAFRQRRLAGSDFFVQHQLRVEELQRPAAEHRECAMGRHLADRLVVVEVVAELGGIDVVRVLAGGQGALEQALLPQPFTQLAHERGVLGPAFGEQVAHTVEHRERIGEAGFCMDERGGQRQRVERRVGEELVGQRLQPRLAGNHPLGTALLLVGQVEVFELLLGRRGVDRSVQFGCQLALFVDAPEHRGAAVFQFAQVGQARLEFAQLDVVQPLGGLLAVARDERHCRATVEQFDGRIHLGRPNLQFGGDLQKNLVQDRPARGGLVHEAAQCATGHRPIRRLRSAAPTAAATCVSSTSRSSTRSCSRARRARRRHCCTSRSRQCPIAAIGRMPARLRPLHAPAPAPRPDPRGGRPVGRGRRAGRRGRSHPRSPHRRGAASAVRSPRGCRRTRRVRCCMA